MSVFTMSAQSGQVTVPRVELMPSQPAPFNVRDWKWVALKYDSFVYDIQRTGQYLPLVNIQASGFNYPQYPAFGLHTYVGTNSPNGNEGINVLPSLVGASLCGVDKTSQFGRNWLEMSRDFYNRANGLNMYTNNKGGGTGSDWWYDVMPNVYFYQLCDLYPPAPGSEAERQFRSVADRFYASAVALGGSETPWSKGNFDYRAFNFATMQPNPNGVHEPEAAGAYAWILYNAWKKTGDERYLKAAEWSLEFLNEWPTNPSYELQLPYGTLAAAQMNAEIGTQYNTEKFVNWSFNKGPLREWGTIVGKWGGFDASGLVGEARDNGNDYAFQLNGVQQAAALIPMVRYDKRFARAIGKWVLNLANATRLFYPGFLPGNYQDATAWSNANDPDRVVGYEALRQVWQGISPYSTGDALNGGWAATNLSLYSCGSIGYLGSVVEKTSVDRILKINVLKTDFFHDQAYPTWLIYNPYTDTRTVAFDAGAAPADLYDALSETFLLEDANGIINLSIPANQALLVTVCPAGGAISYDKNRMLVDGVVVDYQQSQQAWTRGPRIQSAAALNDTLEPGQSTQLFSKVQPGQSNSLNYQWFASSGTLAPAGNNGNWTAPVTPGVTEFSLIVTDGNQLGDTATFTILVVPEINKAPVITDIDRDADYLAPGAAVQLEAIATDPNNDDLIYNWQTGSGTLNWSGNSAVWTAPSASGIYSITVTAADEGGLSDQYVLRLLVKEFSASAPDLIAWYNFSGNANDLTLNQLNGQPFNVNYVPDRFGNTSRAVYFNGVNARVTVPVQPVLNFQDGITVSCWIRPADLPAKETFILSHGSWQNRWKLSVTPDRHLRWTVNTLNSIGDLDSERLLETDTTYQVAVTYDGQLLAMYLDGRLHAFKNLTGKIRTASVAFLMGQMLPGDANYNYKGVLDEVKIYNGAMHPDSVRAMYQLGTTGTSQVEGPVVRLMVTPNPAGEYVRFSWPSDFRPGAWYVTDSGGGQISGGQISGENTIELTVKNWKPGVYMAVFKSENNMARAVFVKE
jgi:hypothetical protein